MLLKLEIKNRFYMKSEADCGVRENWQRIDLISCIVLVFGFQFTFVMNTKLILSSWSVEKFSLRNPRLDFRLWRAV